MKKPGSSYKMSKAGKTNLAMNWHKPGRAARKRSIIQAELYGAEVVKSRKERGDAPSTS
jgi:hypothetical protein